MRLRAQSVCDRQTQGFQGADIGRAAKIFRHAPAPTCGGVLVTSTVRDVVRSFLIASGVTKIFGNPGSTEMRFFNLTWLTIRGRR